MKPLIEYRKFENMEEYLAFEEKSEIRHEYYLINFPTLNISIALKDIYQA